ncbi:hypothetical protein GGX14DRAFT_396626 [Mycena pura]|uniref:Uncharacterized protein n=1 Tax=Mycena pura TaxID=153505 RepID=A0AAD6VAB9_9AGAR|nr:hypothetical protein GGX14DRAFT_396626 [Mycena pura]
MSGWCNGIITPYTPERAKASAPLENASTMQMQPPVFRAHQKKHQNRTEEQPKIVSNLKQGLDANAKGGIFHFFSKATPEQRAAMAERDRESRDRWREEEQDQEILKQQHAAQKKEKVAEGARNCKHKQREREREVDIDLGIRDTDGKLKKRRIRLLLLFKLLIEPQLHDPGIDHDVATKTRPKRAFKDEILAAHRTHASGRKRIHARRPPKYANYKTPFLFRQIQSAGAVNNDPQTGLSASGIVKTLRGRDYRTFAKLSRTTIQGWMEKDKKGRNIWKRKVLDEVELRGDRPGHSLGGPRGALSGHPDVVEAVKVTLTRLREAGAALTLIAVRADCSKIKIPALRTGQREANRTSLRSTNNFLPHKSVYPNNPGGQVPRIWERLYSGSGFAKKKRGRDNKNEPPRPIERGMAVFEFPSIYATFMPPRDHMLKHNSAEIPRGLHVHDQDYHDGRLRQLVAPAITGVFPIWTAAAKFSAPASMLSAAKVTGPPSTTDGKVKCDICGHLLGYGASEGTAIANLKKHQKEARRCLTA